MKKFIISVLFTLLLVVSLPRLSFAETSGNLVPIMTSNNSPSGIVSASSTWSPNHQPFLAFNNNNGDLGWATSGPSKGWISYEFEKPTVVNAYTLLARPYENFKLESPKNWTFEAWNGAEWIVLDTRTNIADWESGKKKEFEFTNKTEYKAYRLNVTENNSNGNYILSIGEIAMLNNTQPTEPEPNPEPNPNPNPPTGDRAILVVTMTNGLVKEYDLPMSDINSFLNWYDAHETGTGSAKYAINKYTNNKGPFSKRTDFVIFKNILTFEVNEYSAK